MIWETFQLPGANEQAMLQPQPRRNTSLGNPLQLIDSNETMPYVGKGKGRARDFEPTQQAPDMSQNLAPHQQPSIGRLEPFHVPGMGFDDMPPVTPQGLLGDLNNFDFNQDQMMSWQPVNPEYFQSGIMDPNSHEFRTAQSHAHPHGHPPPMQQVQIGPAPILPSQPGMQMPLQHAYQPPPGLPQQPKLLDQTIYPDNTTQQQVQTQTQQPLPAAPQPQQATTTTDQPPTTTTDQPSGYRFRPGIGFVCLVCNYSMRQPGIHPFQGGDRWCWADGPDMQLDAAEEAKRRDKRGPKKKKKVVVRLSYI